MLLAAHLECLAVCRYSKASADEHLESTSDSACTHRACANTV